MFVFLDYLFVLPGSPDLVVYLFLLTWGLLYCAYYYSLTPGYLDHLVSFLLLYNHFSPSFLSLMASSLYLCCTQSSFFTKLFFESGLRTYLGFISYFSCLFDFFSACRRSLLIRIDLTFLKIFPLELSNIVFKRFHSIDLCHSLIVTLLELNFWSKLLIFGDLSLSDCHVCSPFLQVLSLPIFAKGMSPFEILPLLLIKLLPD